MRVTGARTPTPCGTRSAACCGWRASAVCRRPPTPAAALAAAGSALERIPRAVDTQGAVAYWNDAASAVVARSYLPERAITLALGAAPTDLWSASMACSTARCPIRIRMHDLRSRWADVTLPLPGFVPWRLAAHPSGGVWALERASGRLARLTGSPLPLGPFVTMPAPCSGPIRRTVIRPSCVSLPILSWPVWREPGRAGQRSAKAGSPCCPGSVMAKRGCAAVDMRRSVCRARFALIGARYAYALDWLDAERIARARAGPPRCARLRSRGGR